MNAVTDISLSPELILLAKAFGLLTSDGFNENWFKDPAKYISHILTTSDQREAAIELAEQLLGDVREQIDLPSLISEEENNPLAEERWIPLVDKTNNEVITGLYAIIESKSDSAGAKLSLGARINYQQAALNLALTLKVPLLKIDTKNNVLVAEFLAGEEDQFIQFSALVEIPDGIPNATDSSDPVISLKGACFNANLPMNTGGSANVQLIVKGLKLPNQSEAADIDIAELGDDLSHSIIDVLLSLLDLQNNDSAQLSALLSLFGLNAGNGIPVLPVAELADRGVEALGDWLQNIVNNEQIIHQWFTELGHLLGINTISGDGTLQSPYIIALAGSDWSPEITLTIEPAASGGNKIIHAGARFAYQTSSSLPAGADGSAIAEIEFLTLLTGTNPVIKGCGHLNLHIALKSSSPDTPFLNVTQAGQSIKVHQLHAGLALNAEQKLIPIIEAYNVTVGTHDYSKLDLLSTDVLEEVGQSVIDDITQQLLTALQINSSEETHALAALAGLVAPQNSNGSWPNLISMTDFFQNPLGAIACYHLRVLNEAGASWSLLMQEMAVLLKFTGIATPTITGSGTPAEPWECLLFDNTISTDEVKGKTSLIIYADDSLNTDGHSDGTSLFFSQTIQPLLPPINGKQLTISHLNDFLQADLPLDAVCPQNPALKWMPGQRIRVALGENLSIESDNSLGSLTLTADSIILDLIWRDSSGWDAEVSLTNAQLEISGSTVELPDFSLEWLDGIDLPDFPWQAIQALLGNWFATGSSGSGNWGLKLAALFSWLPSMGGIRLNIPQLNGFAIDLPNLPALSLPDLFDNPFDALINWLKSLFIGGSGSDGMDLPDFSLPSLAWLSSLFSSFDGLSFSGGDDHSLPQLNASFTGQGTYNDPWAVKLSTAEATPELLLWLDPDGPSLAAFTELTSHLLPVELRDFIADNNNPTPNLAQLSEWLKTASAFIPELHERLAHLGDLPVALEALRSQILNGDESGDEGGDGIVLANKQTVPNWNELEMASVSHLNAPALFDPALHLPNDAPPAARQLYLTAPLPGVSDWSTQETSSNIIDLRDAGVIPSAFDLSEIANTTNADPWFILMPTRAEATVYPDPTLDASPDQNSLSQDPVMTGIEGQNQRLRRVIDQLAQTTGGDIALIAHSISGQVARRVAKDGGVSHLVTLGTPHSGTTFEFLDDLLSTNAVRSLQSLRRMLDESADTVDTVDTVEDIAVLNDLLDTFNHFLDGYVPDPTHDTILEFIPAPLADFTATAFEPLPPSVNATTIITRMAPEKLDRLLATLVYQVLQKALSFLPDGNSTGQGVTHLGFGIRTHFNNNEVASGQVKLKSHLRIDLHRVELQADTSGNTDHERIIPRLQWRTELSREDGWLVGTPVVNHASNTPRDPRIRYAVFELEMTALDPLDISASIDLYDASVFGLHQDHWQINEQTGVLDTPLSQEITVLLGSLTSSLGDISTASDISYLMQLLDAMQLGSIDTSSQFQFNADSLRRFLIDPQTELQNLLTQGQTIRDELILSLRQLLGQNLKDITNLVANRIDIALSNHFDLQLELSNPLSVRIAVNEDQSWVIDNTVEIKGDIQLHLDGQLQSQLSLHAVQPIGPLGKPGFQIQTNTQAIPPVSVNFVSMDGTEGILPDQVQLHPTLDQHALKQWLKVALPGEMLRIAFAELQQQNPKLKPLLTATGLMREESVQNFAGLLASPGKWLADSSILGVGTDVSSLKLSQLKNLIDSLRELFELDIPTAGSGTLPLPFNALLSVSSGDNNAVLLSLSKKPEGDSSAKIQHSSTATIQINSGLSVQAGISSSLRIAGIADLDYAEVNLELPPGSLTAPQLDVNIKADGASELAFTLLPEVTGLDSLVSLDTGINYALPLVLDAAVDNNNLGNVSTSLAALGDALKLREPNSSGTSKFSTAKIQSLANNPAIYLQSCLTEASSSLLAELQQWAAPFLPNDVITIDSGGSLLITPFATAPDISIKLESPANLSIIANGLSLTTGLAMNSKFQLSENGLEKASLQLEVTDAALLGVDIVSILPFIGISYDGTTSNQGYAETGLWLAPPSASPRQAILMKLTFNQPTLKGYCRDSSKTGDDNLGSCTADMGKAYLIPLITDLLIKESAVQDWLKKTVGDSETKIGKVLCQAGILHSDSPDCAPDYTLANSGLLDDLLNQSMPALTNRVWYLATAYAEQLISKTIELDPFKIQFAKDTNNSRTVYGLRLSLATPLALSPSSADTQFSLATSDDSWGDHAPADAGITVLLVSVVGSLTSPEAITDLDIKIAPWIKVRGLGFIVEGKDSAKLIDAAVSVNGIRVDAVYERNFATSDVVPIAGTRCTLLGLGVPIGASGSGNPVASKLLSQESESTQQGDSESAKPVFNAQVTLKVKPDFSLSFKLLDNDEKPIWIPIQQSFGPMYVEQIGIDYTETTIPVSEGGGTRTDTVSALLDGGVKLSGLNIGVDDLKLTVPFNDPANTSRWTLDLAGLAISYQGSGVTLAGGFRKVPSANVEYSGMLQVEIAGFGGLTAIGSYAVFPIAGSSDTYTSMFGFASLLAPIGGPPPFFVTGLGGGMGLNRALVSPDIDQVPTFPLVAALDSQSAMAQDPMQALQAFSQVFPPNRGSFWFAAGVRFTSFALVESIAVVSVEAGDGVEIQILGLSRMELPSADKALASIELALRARVSTREQLMSIQAQLTDNSWLISRDCRLTGGFAFVIWFDTAEFVLTLGGYHPRFAVPAHYPTVPRLGFNWTPGGGLTIKGGSYFALTSSCVMAGGRLEISYSASVVWASLVAGLDILVSWEPFFYEFDVYITVSAGVTIRVCVWLLGCASISLSFSIGAKLHIEGPELRGTAELDLDVTSVTVRFGSRGSTTSKEPITWPAFYNKFLAQGDTSKPTVGMGIISGGLTPDSGAGEAMDTGEKDKPYRVNPEFVFEAHTRMASNTIELTNEGANTTPALESLSLDIAPMNIAGVTSTFTVTIRDSDNSTIESNLDVSIHKQILPDATWVNRDRTNLVPEAKTIEAYTRLRVVVNAEFPKTSVIALMTDEQGNYLVETCKEPHPLPFYQEWKQRDSFIDVMLEGDNYIEEQPDDTSTILKTYRDSLINIGRAAKDELLTDRVSPPILGSLAEGMIEIEEYKPANQTPVLIAPALNTSTDKVGTPRLVSILRTPPTLKTGAHYRQTTVSKTATTRAVTASKGAVISMIPPTIENVKQRWKGHVSTRLEVISSDAQKKGNTVTTVGSLPVTSVVSGVREYTHGLMASGLMASAAQRAVMKRFESIIAEQQSFTINSGDTQIWQLPNSFYEQQKNRPFLDIDSSGSDSRDFDSRDSDSRDSDSSKNSSSAGQTVRIVFLDRAGEVLKQYYSQPSSSVKRIELPNSTDSFTITGLGKSHCLSGYSGWHRGMTLRQVHANTYLAAGAVLQAYGIGSKRHGSATRCALVKAEQALKNGYSSKTLLPANSQTIVIGLDVQVNLASINIAELVTLGLSGARRKQVGYSHKLSLKTSHQQQNAPPMVIENKGRIFAVFEVIADSPVSEVQPAFQTFTVTTVTEPQVKLAAVIGSTSDMETVIEQLQENEIDSLFKPENTLEPAVSSIRWDNPESTSKKGEKS